MRLELFIATRLYTMRKGGRRVSRPAITIAQWGVSIGIIVMMLSMAIVIGFKHEVRDKLVGFGSHILINNYEASLNGESYLTITNEDIDILKKCKGISKIQKYIQKPGLLAVGNEFEGILVKGIGEDYDLSFLQKHLIDGILPGDSLNENWIIISKSLSDKLGCRTGDRINIYFLQDGIKARRLLVTAIYETHLYEMDNLYTYTDIDLVRKLNRWDETAVSGIEISTDKFEEIENVRNNMAPTATKIAKRNKQTISLQTIEEIYPAMFAWLGVLDSTVWIISVLVLGIAGFTMISGLLILILEKSNLIGILKAVGAQNISISKIFIIYACFIIGRGFLIGNIIAILLCFLQQATGIVSLDPEMYYMNRVPIEFSWWMLPMNILMFTLSVIMLLVPSMLISKIEPSKAIKFE